MLVRCIRLGWARARPRRLCHCVRRHVARNVRGRQGAPPPLIQPLIHRSAPLALAARNPGRPAPRQSPQLAHPQVWERSPQGAAGGSGANQPPQRRLSQGAGRVSRKILTKGRFILAGGGSPTLGDSADGSMGFDAALVRGGLAFDSLRVAAFRRLPAPTCPLHVGTRPRTAAAAAESGAPSLSRVAETVPLLLCSLTLRIFYLSLRVFYKSQHQLEQEVQLLTALRHPVRGCAVGPGARPWGWWVCCRDFADADAPVAGTRSAPPALPMPRASRHGSSC